MTDHGVDGARISGSSPLRKHPAFRARLVLLAVAALGLAGAAFAVRGEPAAAPLSAADELAQDVAQRIGNEVQDYVETGHIPGELDFNSAVSTPVDVEEIRDWLQDPPATYWKGRSKESWRVLSSNVSAPGASTPPVEATFVLAVYRLSQDTSFVNSSEWGRTCLRLHVEPASHVVQQERVECADDVPGEGVAHY